MIPRLDHSASLAAAAMAGAAILMAHQVAGKAARDAVFLSVFQPRQLPAMVVAAAVASVILGAISARALSRFSPGKIVPGTFAFSALLHLLEWRLVTLHPRPAAVLIYLHLVALGAVLLSAFWSLTNEALDPHTAKHRFGQIAGAGTLGGILGGLAAERIAAIFSTPSVLLWLGVLHSTAAGILVVMRARSGVLRSSSRPHRVPESGARPEPPWKVFRQAPYLLSLAVLVLLGTATAATVDWVFKAQAAASFGRQEPLMRFFALFHSSVAVITFLVQTFVTRLALQRFGLGRTVGALPLTVAAGGLGALWFPAFPVIAALRGTEFVLRGSLFRSGYELFYAPVPVKQKRAAKSIIDVGVDRLGDALGAAITQAYLMLDSTVAPHRILLTAATLATAGFLVALRLDRGYIQALEKSLVGRAAELELQEGEPATTQSSILHSSDIIPVTPLEPPAAPQIRHALPRQTPRPVRPHASDTVARSAPLEPVLLRLLELRSGSARRVKAELERPLPLDPVLIPQVITLLGWDEVQDAARAALLPLVSQIPGQLTDRLLDPGEEFAVRRRIPALLAAAGGQRAAQGLLEGLADRRFEVRFRCARALAAMAAQDPSIQFSPQQIFAAVERELSVSRAVWEGHKLLDRRDPSEKTLFLDEVLRERSNAGLEHLFTLLSLVLPRDPLMVAFRALHTDDEMLRGLAFEYLETVLPQGVREKLARLLAGPSPSAATQRSGDEILRSLMQSHQSVVLRLREKLASQSSCS